MNNKERLQFLVRFGIVLFLISFSSTVWCIFSKNAGLLFGGSFLFALLSTALVSYSSGELKELDDKENKLKKSLTDLVE